MYSSGEQCRHPFAEGRCGGVRAHQDGQLGDLLRVADQDVDTFQVARTIALDRNLLLYLESLALRAFLAVYGPRVNPIEGLRTFFGQDLPQAVRSARGHILIATLCLLVGTAGPEGVTPVAQAFSRARAAALKGAPLQRQPF